MSEFTIEIVTSSKEVRDALANCSGAAVTTTRNFTGEVIVALSIALPFATVLVKEVGKVLKGRQATVRAQRLKIGKGTISFEGFSADEVGAIIDKLAETHVGERK